MNIYIAGKTKIHVLKSKALHEEHAKKNQNKTKNV